MKLKAGLLHVVLGLLLVNYLQQVRAQQSNETLAVLLVVIPLDPISTVFGTTQNLLCLSVLTDDMPVLIWSSDAVDPDLSNTLTIDNLPEHTESVSLNITVDSGYCGSYTCNETFAVNRLSATVTVDVAPAIVGNPQHTSIGASRLNQDNVSFDCFIDRGVDSTIQVTWRGPGADTSSFRPLSPVPVLTDSGSDSGRDRSTLLVSDNAGDYSCETRYVNATGCTATSQSNTATLFIVTAPTIISEPTPLRQNVTMGATVMYDCSFNASDVSSRLNFQPYLANFSVYWIHNSGIILENGTFYEILVSQDDEIVNTTLIISEVNSTAGGNYTCTAENIDGFISSTVLLYIDPVIEPTNYTVTFNDSLVLTCTVQDYPEPLFTWQKESNGTFQTLDAQIISDGRILSTNSQNLTFERILFDDQGLYRCVAETAEFGSLPSNEVLVTVSPEGGVSVSPLDEMFGHGDNTTLSCDTRGGPGNAFDWTVVRNGITEQGPSSPTFELSPVVGGVYTCVVSNAAGLGNASTLVFVTLRFVSHPNDTLASEGERVILTCEAQSFPSPTYEWIRLDDGDIRGNLSGINTSRLVFDNVLFGDEGNYSCLATAAGDNITSSSLPATLTVSPQGSVSVTPSSQVVNVSNTVVFSCTARGGPDNVYQWYRNSLLLSDETNPNITIFNISSTHGGVYSCNVSNAAGSGVAMATLLVRPYIVVFPEIEIRTRANSSVNFTCVAEGFPEPVITWFKLINETTTVAVETGNVLNFDPVVFGVEGRYVCEAVSGIPDDVLNTTQAPALLTVSPEGSVRVEPVDRVYVVDDNATFTCTSLGGLDNTIQWYKDGDQLFRETGEQLLITDIDSTDGGVYTCTVSNFAGSESVNTTLYVAPYFIDHPLDIRTTNGSNVSFNCLAQAFPDPTYVWRRANNESIRDEAIGSNTNELIYTPVLFRDEGVYYCEATILNVTTPSENATLTLAPASVTVTALPSDELSLGENVTLTCSNLGGPANTYSWLKDGESLNHTDPILALYQVTAMHGGTYTCIVTNIAGNASGDVIVYIHPYITLQPVALVTTQNGSMANFSCEADGFPTPNITWIKYESLANLSVFEQVSQGGVLYFDPVLFGDEGYYGCVASGRGLDGRELNNITSSTPSELAVSPISTVRITPQNSSYFLGDTATLFCTSLGGPNNTYLWLFNETIQTQGPTLTVSNITAQDGGSYTCVATNNAGIGVDSTDIYVHPYIVMQPVLSVLTANNEFGELECIVDGFPAPNVTWESLGTEIQESSGSGMEILRDENDSIITEFDNMPLQFSPIGFGDEGYYRCIVSAQTPQGAALETVTSEPTLITVSPEGSVSVEPSFQVLERFDNITFTCSSLGGPSNTYQWQKDDTNLPNETSTELTLTNVSASDGGVYSCIASNAAGNDSFDSTLFIRPYITLNPVQDTLSFNGDFVTFNCEAESFPAPQYLWEKTSNNNTIVSNNQQLVFGPVQFGAQGVYECVAFIIANLTNLTARSQSALLTVSPLGGVSSSPVVHNSRVNQTVEFLCTSRGGPDNNFTWTHLLDGTVVSNTALLSVTVEGAYTGGRYQCHVTNRAGNDSFQATLNVAMVISEDPLSLNVTITNSFSLSCGARGFPVPDIVWLLNGTEIELPNITMFSGSGSGDFVPVQVTENRGVRSISSQLDVARAFTNDTGNYSCSVISTVYPTIISSPALVLVQDVPLPPHSLFSMSVTNTSMIVVWAEPHDNNAPVTNYTLHYSHPSFLGGGAERIHSEVIMHFIGGLHPGTVYNFSVVATNEIGESEPSVVTGLATLDEEPVSPPPDLSAVVLSSTTVHCSWSELPEIDRNGIITEYQVQYTPLIDCTGIAAGLSSGPGNTTQLLVEGLEENAAYGFRVRALTSAGPGPYSDSVDNTTTQDVPSGSPENLLVSSTSPTQLSVQWLPINCSQRNGLILLYQVQYEALETFNGAIVDPVRYVNTTGLGVELLNLEEFVEYSVVVRGFTVAGAGPFGIPVTNVTMEDFPSAPPTDVTVSTMSSTELLVEWQPPPSVDQNGLITVYQVLYTPLNTYDDLIGSASVSVSGLSVTLTGLQEDTDYNVSVRAVNSVGPGPYSPAESDTTLIDVPGSPPVNIEVTTLGPDQLMVTWDPVPEIHQNGPITFYEILYSPNDTFNGLLAPEITLNTSAGDNTSILLSSLEEFVVYEVSVRAYTDAGPGNYSSPIAQRTLTARPSSPVRNVRATAVNSTSVSVSWVEVEPIDQNGIQTQYEIRFQPNTSISGVQGGSVFSTIPGQYLLTGLEEFVEYIVSVRSYTSAGPGPYSDNITVTTLEDAPSSAPIGLTVDMVSSTELMAFWEEVDAIDRNGIITSYEVVYEPFETFNGRLASSQSVIVPAPTINVRLTGLEEFLSYDVIVRANTSVGVGPFSSTVNETTLPARPSSPPLNVTATVLSSTELRVTWEPPDPINQNGELEEYSIRVFQSTFPEIPTRIINVTDTVRDLLVRGLEEFVLYGVCVYATNSEGTGPCSEDIFRLTLEDTPTAPPQNLLAEADGPTSLRVTWNSPPPIDINGNLTQYRVQYGIEAPGADITDFSVSGFVLEASLTDLANFTCYNVILSAFTVIGEGPAASVIGCTEENVPGSPPTVTELRSNSFESILIRWEPPTDQLFGILRSFTIRHVNIDLSDQPYVYIRNISNTSRSFDIPDLIQFTNYRVEIAAFTVGDGVFSIPMTTQTDQDKPDGFPVNIETFTLSSQPRSLLVRWGEVPRELRNGIITQYNIRYEPLEDYGGLITRRNVIVDQSVGRETTLTDLEEDTQYNVSIQASTVVGEGPFSEEVMGQTSEGVPSSFPANLRIDGTSLSSRNMTILWDLVPHIHRNGRITQYTLNYGPVDREFVFTETIGIDEEMLYNALDLIPAQTYFINIAASTEQGRGEFSGDINSKTLEETPGPVSIIKVTERFTSVTVEWREPEEPNGEILSYDITYNVTGEDNVLIDRIRPVDTVLSQSIPMEGLLSTGQAVSMSVRAHTRIGPGPSISVQATTRDRPPLVQNVSVTYSEFQRVATVSWSPLTGVDAENVVQYMIVYTHESGESTTIFVNVSESSATIRDLLTDAKYSFKVSAVARIEDDTIEGVETPNNLDAFLSVPATLAPLETREVQFGATIPVIIILTVILCVIAFVVYLQVKKYRKSRKKGGSKQRPQLQFEEGHYESVEMIRRQLPRIPVGPPSLSGRNTPSTSVHQNTSYQATSPPPDQLDDVYDNDDLVFKSRSERYSRLKHGSTSAKPTPVSSPKSTVISNSEAETYDSVVDQGGEEPVQDVYDNDPFDKEENQTIIRRNSNPNIYSEVNTPKLSRPATSLIVTNPSTVLGKPKAAASKSKSPPPPSQPPPPNAEDGSSSGEEYEDMSQSLSIASPTPLLTGNTSAKPADSKKPKKITPETKSSKDPPKPYFEFTDEYDTIISDTKSEIQAAKLTDSNVPKKTDSSETKSSEDPPKPYFEFTDEYDTIISDTKSEIQAAKSTDSNEPKKIDSSETKSSEDPPKPYFEFTDEYDTIISDTKSEIQAAKQLSKTETKATESGSYLQFKEDDSIVQTTQEEMEPSKGVGLDNKGVESQGPENFMMALSGDALINSQT